MRFLKANEDVTNLIPTIIFKPLWIPARAQVGIDWDSLAVWAGNRIPSYLWKKWKFELSGRGFTWPQFLKPISYLTRDARAQSHVLPGRSKT